MREGNDTTMNLHARTRFDLRDCAVLVALCVLTALVLGKDIGVGGLHDPDSSAHAMDGVLIHDWIATGGEALTSPMSFAREQYAHYPTLGIGAHYPPAFAIVEAGFYGVFGISPATARLCVVFFGMLAACGVYCFVRSFADTTVAALAAVIMITMPSTTTWGRQVMLEIPTLAAVAWASVAFLWYLRRTTWLRLGGVLLVSLSAMSFKQPAVFLVCTVAAAMFFGSVRGRIPMRQTVVALLVGFGALWGVFSSLDAATVGVLRDYDSFGNKWGLESLSFYMMMLPSQVGAVVLALAGVGLFLLRPVAPEVRNFLLCWFGIVYVMVTVASLKTTRFSYLGLLPIAVLAALSLAAMLRTISISHLRPVGAIAAGLAFFAVGMGRTIEHAPNYGPVVEKHREQIEGNVVMFSGLRDGDFVFATRERLPWRRTTVIRGSKIFYTCAARPDFDLVQYVHSKDEVAERMREFAFPFVFVERENHVGTQPDAWLREYLADGDDYRRVASYPFQCEVEDSDRGDVTIDVYELVKPYVRAMDFYDLPMPRTGNPIRVNFPKRIAMAESGG